MPEVHPAFSREWADIPDPEGRARIFRCDLTWLTSRWNCIYGNGCAGTRRPHQGCCTVGAHWTGSKDRQRVEACARRLPGDLWQFRETGQSDGFHSDDADGGLGQTRTVEGACIFLNRPGFPAGPGCALHLLALAEGRQPLETKPDVCWQIPLRISYSWDRLGSADTLIVTIGEYDRSAWGPGGADMNWWCTSNTDAHTAGRPLYLTNAAELIALIGRAGYREVARACEERCHTAEKRHPHPADQRHQTFLPVPAVRRPPAHSE